MTTTVTNNVKAAALIAFALAIGAMGIYLAETDDAPGAAVIGLLLMIGAVVLGVKAARNRLPAWAARTALTVGVLIAAFAAFACHAVAVTVPLFAQPQDVPSVVDSALSPQYAAAVERAQELVRAAILEQNLPGISVAVGAGLPSAALAKEGGTICPIIDSSSRYGFVTLRGGGLFVVNAKTTPMTIVGEYDHATVRGNGCGGVEIAGKMYINSGGSPVNVSGTDPHHPALYGFDVYRFPLTGYSSKNLPNTPFPELLLSKSGASDSHGVVATRHDRYLWALDRHANVAEIIHLRSGKWVNTVNLAGEISNDPAPDLVDAAPNGKRLFVALRGPVPLSGDPHNAQGTTPGLGIIHVTHGGRSGRLLARVPLTNANQQAGQAPDAHGLRVRLRRLRK
jgi:hypothetical protein